VTQTFVTMANARIKPEPTLQNVLDEIEMYQVLLKSIYDSANPDEELKEEYEEKLAVLQGELETLQPQPMWDTLSSETSSQQGEADARSQSTLDVKDELSSTTSDQNLVPSVTTESPPNPSAQNEFLKSEQITDHNFLAGFASSSPSGNSAVNPGLPTRKRPFSGEHDYAFSKSRRATPSPAISAATTPSSTSDFDDILANLLGSDVRQEFKEYEKEQREWDARQEQERRDAELARSIQESWNLPVPLSRPQPSSTIP
jgi:hypothetical protein